MKIIKVMVLIELTCPRCGSPMTRLGHAGITSDNRIGKPELDKTKLSPCDACVKKDQAENDEQRRLEYERRRWVRDSTKRGLAKGGGAA